MTSSNSENIGERILKIKLWFFLCLFATLFELEKYAFFKIAFLGQKNVHFVLNILFRRWKLSLAFLEFLYLFRIFLSAEFI